MDQTQIIDMIANYSILISPLLTAVINRAKVIMPDKLTKFIPELAIVVGILLMLLLGADITSSVFGGLQLGLGSVGYYNLVKEKVLPPDNS